MPLLDHFHPPLSTERHWDSFYSSWATRIADALMDGRLPPNYIAKEHVHVGASIEIDVATFTKPTAVTESTEGSSVATAEQKVRAPPAADGTLAGVFPDTFEVRVLSTDTGPKLVAAIKLISPGNKDRPAERRAFATKCASYLHQGISVILIDIVTNRRANLHNELLDLMEAGGRLPLPAESNLYGVAYRPLRRGNADEIDVWRSELTLQHDLPTLPLGLRGDLAIPVDFEATYTEACRRKRLTGS